MDKVKKTALLIIDMQNGFLDPASPLCIRTAAATVPACALAAERARAAGMPVFFVRRQYRADGSDVEKARREVWEAGGRPLAPGSLSADGPEGLRPRPEDQIIYKPRWSAFFATSLDLVLRRLEVGAVALAGTTTPNCIRATCYDALALDYGVTVLEDCCSSQTEEIQRVNLEDMRRAGAEIVRLSHWI